MTSRVMNFLWLNLCLPPPPDPEEGIHEPLPARYIENLRTAAAEHASAELMLWVDSKRLTEKQLDYIKASIEQDHPNLHLRDLRSIPAYDQEPLYNESETNSFWRAENNSLIWRQVDAAKILVSLQGNFDQSFFVDFDHAHLDIDSQRVQSMIKNHGMMIGSGSTMELVIENQLWGFDNTRRSFFQDCYDATLKAAYRGLNGWRTLLGEVEDLEDVYRDDICLPINSKGPGASQPGHQWSENDFDDGPSLISAGQLAAVFKKANGDAAKTAKKKPAGQPAAARKQPSP